MSLYVVHMERQAPSPDRALDRAAGGGCRATPGGWPGGRAEAATAAAAKAAKAAKAAAKAAAGPRRH